MTSLAFVSIIISLKKKLELLFPNQWHLVCLHILDMEALVMTRRGVRGRVI